MKAKSMKFNELPINSVFIWGDGLYFLKLKNAIPGVGMSKQPSNCFDLQKQHYCTMTSDHICKLVKQPDDFDLGKMNNPEIPVGTTVHINPKDIKWEVKGDLISRSALKKSIKSYADDQYAENEYLGECAIMDIIDNAPTVEEVSVIEFKEPLPLVKAQKIVKTLSKRSQGDLISRDDLRNARPEYMNEKVVRDTKYRTSKDRIYAKAWNACNHYWLNTIDTAPTVAPEATMRGKRMTIDYDLFREKLNALNDEIFKTTNEQQVLPVLAIHKILKECEV